MTTYEKKMIGVMLFIYLTVGTPLILALVATIAK